jgi:hypothetical protein
MAYFLVSSARGALAGIFASSAITLFSFSLKTLAFVTTAFDFPHWGESEAIVVVVDESYMCFGGVQTGVAFNFAKEVYMCMFGK